MTTKLLGKWGTGCALRAVLSVIVPVVSLGMCAGCALFSALLPLPRFMDTDATRSAIFLTGLPLFLFTFVIGIIGFALWSRARIFKQLDQAFAPLGLTGRGYMLSGRQYHGTLAGRKVEVFFSRQRWFGGFGSHIQLRLKLNAAITTQTTLAIKSALGAAVSQAFGRQPISIADPEFNNLTLYASDESWARALLADSVLKVAALRLTTAPGAFEIRRLDIGPEAVHLWLDDIAFGRISSDSVRQWIDDLAIVARVGESLTPAMI